MIWLALLDRFTSPGMRDELAIEFREFFEHRQRVNSHRLSRKVRPLRLEADFRREARQ